MVDQDQVRIGIFVEDFRNHFEVRFIESIGFGNVYNELVLLWQTEHPPVFGSSSPISAQFVQTAGMSTKKMTKAVGQKWSFYVERLLAKVVLILLRKHARVAEHVINLA